MIYEHAYLRVAADNQAAFEQAAPKAREILLSVHGCREVLINKSVDVRDLYLLRVGWDRIEDHLERFATSDQGAALGDLIGGLFAEPPVVEHFEDRDLSA
ncbi:antibiotic biosynthesis monooxygenase family protein [Nocardioides sp. LHG3406-4]|uniref:antibiotic biosynthesis monooxygenase family protein n=1 Tax=Nocardioides sp. LHG3406-4 TaxID=2804575 RepID=UPI003CF05D28